MRPDLLKFVMENTEWMEASTEFKIRIWATLNGITEHAYCKTCSTLIKEKELGKWKVYCGKQCQHSDPSISEMVIERAKKRDVNAANEKRAETNINRYGVAFHSQRDSVKEIIRDTSRTRILSPGAKELLDSKEWLIDQHITKKKNVTMIAKEIGCYYESVIKALEHFSIEFTPDTAGIVGDSLFQQEVAEFVKSVYSGPLRYNDRTIISPKEIDIYLPELKFGIECNGLFFHSIGQDDKQSKTYHIDKKNSMIASGASLMMVNENDWNFRKDIIKSMLAARIGVSTRIPARETEVRLIDKSMRKQFFVDNHISGDSGASIQVGLFHHGELVSCMSFSKPRFSKEVDYELIRFATKKFHTVVGGGSKILKFFKTNFPGTIGTYADRMYGDGKGYIQMGFEFVRTTSHGYYWTDKVELFNRMSFMKLNLKKKFPEVDMEGKTEEEIMFSQNYRKFYDCGHNYFVLG